MFPDQERWARADALLDAALDLVPEEVESFLDRECRGDQELRRLVESLLAAESRADSVLDRNPALLATTLPDPGRQVRNSGEIDLRGRRLGAFQIVGEIGRGGMAVVYRARRVTDGIVQDVAIKVLARSLASSDARARFRRERQILAASDHPGMARLLDGGETEEGLLYLVMELVEGERIDAYCDRQRGAPPWDLAEILDRLGEIAHTKGKLEVATNHLREAAALRETHHGRAAAAVSLDKLARVAVDQGDLAGAERLFEEVLGYYIDRDGPDHPKVLVTQRRRANLLRRIGRLEEAGSEYDRVIEQHRAVLGDGHPMTWIAVQEAMFVARDLGDLEKAWQLIDQARSGLRRTAGAEHPMTLQAQADAAAVLTRRGELDAARAILLEALSALVAVLGDQAPMTIAAELQLLALDARRGLDVVEQVESLAERAHAALGPTHAHTAAACHRAAALSLERGDRDRARGWLRRALTGDYRSRLEHEGLLALAREDLAAELGAWRERRTTRGVDDGSG